MKYIFKIAPFLLIALLVFQYVFGEVTIVNKGLGFDGPIYAKLTQNFSSLIQNKAIDSYRIQRIIPSFIVYALLGYTKTAFTEDNIIIFFKSINLFLIFASFFIWSKILDILNIKSDVKKLSYILLFGSFAVLKFSSYMPVMTDIFSFCLGLLSLWASLKRQKIILLIISVLGYFVLPTLFYFSIILFIFSDCYLTKSRTRSFAEKTILIALYLFFGLFFIFVEKNLKAGCCTQNINLNLLLPSLVFVAAYLYFVLRQTLFSKQFFSNQIFKRKYFGRFFIAILVFLILTFIKNSFPKPVGINEYDVFENLILSPLIKPGIFIVAHFVYFGPVILLLLINIDRIFALTEKINLGIRIIFEICLIMFLFSETRLFINLLPFICFFVVLYLRAVKLKLRDILIILFGSVIVSKFWLPLNGNLNYYFANFGSWMSNRWYFFQGLIALAICIWMLRLKKRYEK